MKHQFFSDLKGGWIIREFILNDTIYRETIFNGFFVTANGDVAKIKFDKNNKLKSFFLMRQETAKSGHHRVEINKKHYFVHRLVYQTWNCEELKNDMVIDHIDANPANNSITNLRQVTQKANIENAIGHGNFGHNHNTIIEVYDKETNRIKQYNSIKEFLIDINAPDYMIKHGGLSGLKKKKEYSRYIWRKIDEH